MAENHQLWLKSASLLVFVFLPRKSEFFHIENTRVIPALFLFIGMAVAFSFAEAFMRKHVTISGKEVGYEEPVCRKMGGPDIGDFGRPLAWRLGADYR